MASLLVGNARVIGHQARVSDLYLRCNKVIRLDELTMAKGDERETVIFSYIHHKGNYKAMCSTLFKNHRTLSLLI